MEYRSELNRFLADSRTYFKQQKRAADQLPRQPSRHGDGSAKGDADRGLPEWHPYAVWRRHVLADR